MNKNKFIILFSFFILLACVDAQGAEPTKMKMGTSAIQFAAQTKCTHDIDDFAAWKVASKLMTRTKNNRRKSKFVNVLVKMHLPYYLHQSLL